MKSLFEEFRRPWTCVQDEDINPELYGGGFVVYDAEMNIVMLGSTYSGDEDEQFNLNRTQVAELVAIVNAGVTVP